MMATKGKGKNETVQVWNFRGRYADYMRDLCGDAAAYQKIFDEIYHGYVFCGLYGLIKGKRHKFDPAVDNQDKVDNLGFRWAYADAVGLYSYENLRKMVILFHRTPDESFTDKIDNALRFDFSTNDVPDPDLAEKSHYGENSDLIDEYVLGGLELIHEKVMSTASSPEMVDLVDEILNEIQEEIERKTKPTSEES